MNEFNRFLEHTQTHAFVDYSGSIDSSKNFFVRDLNSLQSIAMHSQKKPFFYKIYYLMWAFKNYIQIKFLKQNL